jgi:Ca2+-binding RTX toxin-like protein
MTMLRNAPIQRRIGLVLTVMGLLLWGGLANATPSSRSSEASGAAATRVLAPATATMITFETDGATNPPEPFTSKDNPTVHFIDSSGSNLQTYDATPESDGIGLGVFSDDHSALVMLFDVATTKVSILFGNDDACCSNAGDRATLTVFSNGAKVGTVNVTMNRNDAGDQRITYSGAPVDKARFVYNRAGAPIDLIEVVDNIITAPVCAISGNASANTLKGNSGNNGMCGKGGADKMDGRGGNDVVSGGPAGDTLTGGDGNDLIFGGDGDDVIRASDGASGNDTVYGGSGSDSCFVDAGDTTVGCESVVTNP